VHNKNAFVKAMMHINDESSKHPPPPAINGRRPSIARVSLGYDGGKTFAYDSYYYVLTKERKKNF